MDSNGGLDGRLAASTINGVAVTTGGFVAVGSHGAGQAIWISPDGKHWNPIGVNLPTGARSATLTSVAASGSRVVAAGYADTPAGTSPWSWSPSMAAPSGGRSCSPPRTASG